MLAIPGINVVSAADLAGEMGPIEHYANANAITGRAGLFPGRYQSDQVDHTTSLIRCGNKRLRDALMQIGDNLITCNDHFHGLAELWRARDVDPRLQRVRVVKQFSRLAFAMLAGRQVAAPGGTGSQFFGARGLDRKSWLPGSGEPEWVQAKWRGG